MKKALIIILFALLASCSRGPVTMPRIFSDHMVIQRDRPVPVWGSAQPFAPVTLEWQGRTLSVKADSDGRWRAELPATEAGGPYTLKVNDTLDLFLIAVAPEYQNRAVNASVGRQA